MLLHYLPGMTPRQKVQSLNKLRMKRLPLGRIILIVAIALLQALGFCRPLECSLIESLHFLVPGFLPSTPSTLLLSLEKSSLGFSSMDVAMSLRGLGELNSRCVIIDGSIQPEEVSVPYLPGILSQLTTSGIQVILPQVPSPTNSEDFRSVPLIRYSLRSNLLTWPHLEGRAIPGKGAAFLPSSPEETNSLPLLAATSDGTPIGSLWWWALPESTRKTPFLLSGKILFLGNHTPLHLTPDGELRLSHSESVMEIPLDDFLLRLEEREQGKISPSFDALWKNATVVIGSHDDLASASAFNTLVKETIYSRFSLGDQCIMIVILLMFFLISRSFQFKNPSHPPLFLRWRIRLGFLLLLIVGTVLGAHYSLIVPFLPALVAGTLLTFDFS